MAEVEAGGDSGDRHGARIGSGDRLGPLPGFGLGLGRAADQPSDSARLAGQREPAVEQGDRPRAGRPRPGRTSVAPSSRASVATPSVGRAGRAPGAGPSGATSRRGSRSSSPGPGRSARSRTRIGQVDRDGGPDQRGRRAGLRPADRPAPEPRPELPGPVRQPLVDDDRWRRHAGRCGSTRSDHDRVEPVRGRGTSPPTILAVRGRIGEWPGVELAGTFLESPVAVEDMLELDRLADGSPTRTTAEPGDLGRPGGRDGRS